MMCFRMMITRYVRMIISAYVLTYDNYWQQPMLKGRSINVHVITVPFTVKKKHTGTLFIFFCCIIKKPLILTTEGDG